MVLDTIDFSTEPLQPFGERWTHGERKPLMVESLTHKPQALAEVVQKVRRAGVLVMRNTQIGKFWEGIEENPNDRIIRIAHVDSNVYTPPVLHLLHAGEGRLSPTGYAKRADLTQALKNGSADLAALIEGAAPWVRDTYRLNELLEACRDSEFQYSFDAFHPYVLMGMNLEYMRGVMDGWIWSAGEHRSEIATRASVLQTTYDRLLTFYQTVSRQSPHYLHHWEPGDTVLAYQDPQHEFDMGDPRIFHFNAGDGTCLDHRILHRDMVLRSEDRRENPYEAASANRANRSRW